MDIFVHLLVLNKNLILEVVVRFCTLCVSLLESPCVRHRIFDNTLSIFSSIEHLKSLDSVCEILPRSCKISNTLKVHVNNQVLLDLWNAYCVHWEGESSIFDLLTVLREKSILSANIFSYTGGDHGWAIEVGYDSSAFGSTVGAFCELVSLVDRKLHCTNTNTHICIILFVFVDNDIAKAKGAHPSLESLLDGKSVYI